MKKDIDTSCNNCIHAKRLNNGDVNCVKRLSDVGKPFLIVAKNVEIPCPANSNVKIDLGK